MTPEEFNRKIKFIVESQARLAAAQEQGRQDRVEFQELSTSRAKFIGVISLRSFQVCSTTIGRTRLWKFEDSRI